ncbi:hypothetical protein B1759_17580 [Rubrivirga sp. SAORIC476]|uniref:hypothetical protein n=1 Tax=Rubrivirga sp. SAORIC476 TaxID=1961794 RepID=UPI000BA98492|nr:hypothetical protein [Rubrivirga sp. SAORIC476]PAP74757.1 hypothetical protein B1759_17580 [Rubrivirga sp. SAORIC476]
MLALLLLLAAPFQTAGPLPPPVDSTDVALVEAVVPPAPRARVEIADEPEGDIEFRPRVAPSALYSPNRGLGIGAGVGIRNVGWPGSDLTADVRLQQHYQSADVSFFTADPLRATTHGLLTVGASTTDRRRYYGLGPGTLRDSEIFLDHDAAEAEARFGAYPLGTTALYVQPSVRLLYDRSNGINDALGGGTLADLDEASREALVVADGTRTGASLGLELATDRRDWAPYPRSGMVAAIEHRRFVAFDDSDLTLARYGVSAVGYVPVRGRTVLVFRGIGLVTRSGDADGDGQDDPIPYYYLPTLDARVATAYRPDRLTGRDVLAAGAGIRAPVFDFLGVYGIDVLAMGYLGNAYDNVFEQFTPRVSFENGGVVGDDGSAALRPSLALGLGLVNLDKETVVLGGLLGVGPDGVTLASLRIAYDLRDARALFR